MDSFRDECVGALLDEHRTLPECRALVVAHRTECRGDESGDEHREPVDAPDSVGAGQGSDHALVEYRGDVARVVEWP